LTLSGVHGIFHVASPVAFELCTWEQVVEPAAQGTLSLLESAHSQAGGQLRSVVVTSSGTTVITPAEDAPPGYIFTENDQNTWAIPLAKSVPADFAKDKSGPLMYSASKVAAEQAMWQFKEDRRPSFAISSIHPSVVLGPSLNLPRNPQDLNVSLKPIYEIYSGTESAYPPPIGTASFVDMRDVAAVHLWALEHPEMADGERYIASSGFAPTQGMVDLMREQFPGNSHIALGEPGKGYVGGIDYCQQRVPVWYPKDRIQMCGIKAHKVMQIRWRTLGETVRDTVLAFQEFYGKEAGQSSIT
jgi:nucleoside-diphosphate-sugar epimerase